MIKIGGICEAHPNACSQLRTERSERGEKAGAFGPTGTTQGLQVGFQAGLSSLSTAPLLRLTLSENDPPQNSLLLINEKT